MTEYKGQAFAINGLKVTAPDEDVWDKGQIGESLEGLQKRSPYRVLEWRKRIVGDCQIDDWMQHDNTVLTSITTRPDPKVNYYETYTDAICTSVSKRGQRDVGLEMVAVFKVRISSGS